MKKLFAALLALTMILSSLPAMADDASLVTIGSGVEALDSGAESIVPIGSGASLITPAPAATQVTMETMPSRETNYGYLLPSGGTL